VSDKILVKLRNIKKSYQIGDNYQSILNGVALDVRHGELMSVMGQSDSRKSNIIGLLDRPDEGKYYFEYYDVCHIYDDMLAGIRNHEIGFVFHDFFLLPHLTSLENVCLPLVYREMDKQTMHERAMVMLGKVSMVKWAQHNPNELSVGQQQRVAITIDLVGQLLALMLANEPAGASDIRIGQEILDLFLRLNEAENTALVMITHDSQVAIRCKYQVMMQNGLTFDSKVA